MYKKIITVLAIIPLLLLNTIFSLTYSGSASVSISPTQVTPDQKITLEITYNFQGKNDWYDFFTGGRSIFFRVYYGPYSFRVGNCVTNDLSNPSCDIPYDFSKGAPTSGKITFQLPVPQSPGTYSVRVEMAINRANSPDPTVYTTYASFTVITPTPVQNVTKPQVQPNVTLTQPTTTTTAQPTQVSPQCTFSNINIYTDPPQPTDQTPINIYVEFTYSCTQYSEYGPFLVLRIKDSAGSTIIQYRIGDQGVTTDTNTNYYFDPRVSKPVRVVIPNIQLKPGTYYITLQGRYSVKWWPDFDIFPEYRAYTLVVSSSATGAPTTQQPAQMGTCPGRPILTMVAWAKDNVTLSAPAARVGDLVKALVKVKNPYTRCIYSGNLKIEIRKQVPLAPDPVLTSQVFPITLNPQDEKFVELEFVPQETGEFHYDVFWNDQKYGPQDVQVRYGTVKGDYVGPVLTVSPSLQEIAQKEPQKTFSVISYWFEQQGVNVTQLIDNIPALGCVLITSSVDTQADVTLKVKAFAGVPALGPVGDLAPDPVKASVTRTIQFQANVPVKLCAQFTPIQTSAIHNEIYYMTVEVNGKEIGLFPPDKQGAVLVPKTGLPWIMSQDKSQNIIIINHGWYTDTEPVRGQMNPPGTYYVRVELANQGTSIAQTTLRIIIRQDVDFWFDSNFDTCSKTIILKPGEMRVESCSFELPDGKYHYEIYIGDQKVVPRGPTIYIGFAKIFDIFIGFIKSIGLPLFIVLVIIFFTGPFWIPFVINVIKAWSELIERLKRR